MAVWCWLTFRAETIRQVNYDCKTNCCTPHPILYGWQNREEWDGLGMWRVWVRRGGVYSVLLGKPEGRRQLGRPRPRWVDNIRMYLRKVGCGYMDWIGLAQDRDSWRTLVSAVMNLQVPWNAVNFLTSCKPASFSRKTLRHGVSMYVFLEILVYTCDVTETRFEPYWNGPGMF